MLILTLGLTGCTSTPKAPIGQQSHQLLEEEVTKTIRTKYLLYLPENYDERKGGWPLMLFLHGAGERGDRLDSVKIHGPPKLIENGRQFPFIILSPQCPTDQWWSVEVLDVLIKDVCKHYRVDEDRIYVTGLSMGGYGTWALALEYPNRFAAIAPICGGGNPLKARILKHLPIWVFHGAKDDVVDIQRSKEMVEALKEVGGNVKFTVYPEAGHDSWSETYSNPELYEWFLEHRR